MRTSLCPFCLKMVQTETCPYCGKDVNYPGYPNHLPVGFTLNGMHPYVMGAAIGQGGFGITYIAIDAVTNQRVAVKEYFPNHCCGRNNSTYVLPSYGQEDTFAKGKQHFLEEAQMLQSLADIESIVKVLDYFEANNAAYLVMEFLDGISLKGYVESNGKMSASVFLDQMKPMMEDMTKMHRRGVIHRDIAPDNIIMLQDGKLKLIDFGAARSYVGDKSMTVVVKKGFAPVEQYMRKGSNASTDVYALAATIYYCLTGVIPPDSAARQYGEEVMMAPSLLGADVTAQQEHALEKALELQPKDRIQSISGLQDLLFATAPKPIGQQTLWEENCHTLQKNCPVMVESLQLAYDYDRGTAIVRPVLRSLTNGNLQKITVELWGEVSEGNRMSLAQYDIPCKNVKRNQFFGEENPVALPLGDLQNVRLSVVSAYFKGGVQIQCDSAWEEIAQQEPLEYCLGNDPEILQEYRAETTVQAVWTPVAGEYYWRCGCGNLNLSVENICNRCGTGKQKLFAALDAQKLAEIIAERKTEEIRIREEEPVRIIEKISEERQKMAGWMKKLLLKNGTGLLHRVNHDLRENDKEQH